MSFSRTCDPLGRALRRTIPGRPFGVRFWDGTTVEATNGADPSRWREREAGNGSGRAHIAAMSGSFARAPTFRVKSPAALAHVLRSPSALGLGRAYVDGSLDVDDIDAAAKVLGEWRPPPLGLSDRARIAAGLVLAALPGGLARRPKLELVLHGKRHTRARDRAAVRYHYDAGNDFFGLFLDEAMVYSCAIYSRGAKTLEEAQRAKLGLVANKLGLEPGMSVLDVGCGWGAFAIYAAREHGVEVTGLTLSPAQAELARARVADAGLTDRVKIMVCDYRDVKAGPFEAISSIGMSEHVGAAQIDDYAKSLHRLLRPGGVLLNHAIAAIDDDEDTHGSEFTMRYVFPDGELLPLSRVQLAFERAGLQTDHVEGFREDYSKTLAEWAKRFDARLGEAERLVGPERTRVWRLYLRGARYGFDAGLNAVYQVRARRPG
ncbi:MAG TPA: cyclopropane-fatty-acyl-phospholipid synthase family protein [Solirubrobacteraceae bacterium]|nr:cyclopropane-fatty-acyl-phospholipid synthase family protein [Solirubrobacteraceae bacterium]